MFKKIISAALTVAALTVSFVIPASSADKEIKIVSKTIYNGEVNYSLNTDGITDGELIAASYNNDSTLYAVSFQNVSDGKISVEIPSEKATVKLMVWNSLSDMEPLCKSVENNPYTEEYESIPGASTTYSSISILWDKPKDYKSITGYNIYVNGELAGTTDADETYYTAENLASDTEYIFSVTSITGGEESEPLVEGCAKTDIKGTVRDVINEPYNAKGDGKTLDTAAIQAAIDDCEPNDIVLIPEGKTFLTGALDLKSNMTLEVNGTLLSSKNAEDFEKIVNPDDNSVYEGGTTAGGAVYNSEAQKRLIWSRIEGWEQYCYRSLINIGYLTEGVDYGTDSNYVCENVKIIGSGTITGDDYRANYAPIKGNATALAIDEGNNADKFYDIDSTQTDNETNYVKSRIRGRLINVSNAQNVYIKGITVAKPPMWAVHMIYSDNIVTNGLTFSTSGYRNGDGWDPDSSSNCTIYNSTFSTGDDCVAIKSGKNPEGNAIARPAKNIKVIGCKSDGGLGLAVGSEMSGGVEGVYVRDCVLSNTRYGIEIKANKVRGGYVKDLHVQDSTVDQILIHSVSYNADGEASPESPVFSDMSFNNMNIIGYDNSASSKWITTSITMNGFDGGEDYYVQNIVFRDIVLGTAENNVEQAVSMKKCKNITFDNVLQTDGYNPSYNADNTAEYEVLNGKEPEKEPSVPDENPYHLNFAEYADDNGIKASKAEQETYKDMEIHLNSGDSITSEGLIWTAPGTTTSDDKTVSNNRFIKYTPMEDGTLSLVFKGSQYHSPTKAPRIYVVSGNDESCMSKDNSANNGVNSTASSANQNTTLTAELKKGNTYYIWPYYYNGSDVQFTVSDILYTPAE